MIQAWWSERAAREKLLIAVAGALVVILIGSQLVISPLLAARADAVRDYERAARDLADVRAGASAVAAQRARVVTDGADVRGVVAATAAQRGLVLARVQPLDDAVSVTIDAVTPDVLYGWLLQLEAEHGVIALTANVARVERTGRLRAALTLGRERAV